MKNFIQLNENDNVVIALRTLEMGDILNVNGIEIKLLTPVNFGHKLAIKAIAAKENVLKYGVPIGSATQNISIGEHVHTQNLETNYLPSH